MKTSLNKHKRSAAGLLIAVAAFAAALTGCQSGGASPSGAQPAPSQTGEEKDAVVIVMNMELQSGRWRHGNCR